MSFTIGNNTYSRIIFLLYFSLFFLCLFFFFLILIFIFIFAAVMFFCFLWTFFFQTFYACFTFFYYKTFCVTLRVGKQLWKRYCRRLLLKCIWIWSYENGTATKQQTKKKCKILKTLDLFTWTVQLTIQTNGGLKCVWIWSYENNTTFLTVQPPNNKFKKKKQTTNQKKCEVLKTLNHCDNR